MVELCPVCGRPVSDKALCACRASEALRAEAALGSLELDAPPARSVAPPAIVAAPRVAMASGRPPPMGQGPLPPGAVVPRRSVIGRMPLVLAGVVVALIGVLLGRSWLLARWRMYVADDFGSQHHAASHGMLEATYPDDFGVASSDGRLMLLQRREHPEETVVLWAPAATSNVGAVLSGPDTTTLRAATEQVTGAIAKLRGQELQIHEQVEETCRSGAEESLVTTGDLGPDVRLWTCAFRNKGVVYVAAYTVGADDAWFEGPRLAKITRRTGVLGLSHCVHMDSGYVCPPR